MSVVETVAAIALGIDKLVREYDAPRAIVFSETDWMRFTTDSDCLRYLTPTVRDAAPRLLDVPVLIVRQYKGAPAPINAKMYEKMIDSSAAFAGRVKFSP